VPQKVRDSAKGGEALYCLALDAYFLSDFATSNTSGRILYIHASAFPFFPLRSPTPVFYLECNRRFCPFLQSSRYLKSLMSRATNREFHTSSRSSRVTIPLVDCTCSTHYRR
jgi:hypothetical protein